MIEGYDSECRVRVAASRLPGFARSKEDPAEQVCVEGVLRVCVCVCATRNTVNGKLFNGLFQERPLVHSGCHELTCSTRFPLELQYLRDQVARFLSPEKVQKLKQQSSNSLRNASYCFST